MIALIQRVTKASVTFKDETRSIDKGYLVLLGVEESDTKTDASKIANKLIGLRIMADTNDKMNLSLKDANAQLLLISQFTLISDASRGYRPSFIKAARPQQAKPLFDQVSQLCHESGIPTKIGFFGEYMKVELTNDGPTTIILNSRLI